MDRTGETCRVDSFVEEVEGLSHAGLNRCSHCLACSGGCPFPREMDVLPNAVIRMVQLGFRKEVLASSSIWLCVGCNTCSSECPNAVDMAAIMDTLRQIALREGLAVAEPGILKFHQAVVGSISRYGRTHKLDIMVRYKFCEKDLFSDLDLGLKLLSRRKLDLLPSRVRDRDGLDGLFRLAGEWS